VLCHSPRKGIAAAVSGRRRISVSPASVSVENTELGPIQTGLSDDEPENHGKVCTARLGFERRQHDIVTIGIHMMHRQCVSQRRLIETFAFERYVLFKDWLLPELVAFLADLIRRLCVTKFKLVTNHQAAYDRCK
jgi:hypothetical protein